MKRLRPMILLAALMLLFSAAQAANARTIPMADAKADHNTCLKSGFTPGEQEDPATENYFNCRAEIATTHMIKPVINNGKLTTEETEHNNLMSKVAKSFSEKAMAARDYRLNGYQTLIREWEKQQSDAAKQYDAADHKKCVSTGLEPSVWGSPDTEKYYLCRAGIIEKRALTKPIAMTNNKRVPQAALFFFNKAREASYAFSSVDLQTHRTCLGQGIYPGEWEDPKTQKYYECRAQLADTNMGRKVAAIFRARARRAAEAAADSQPCINKGFAKGTAAYQKCRKAIITYRQCLSEIGTKLAVQKRQDDSDCAEDARLRFPGRGKRTTASRNKATAICLRQRDNLRKQGQVANLKLECADIMDFNRPR